MSAQQFIDKLASFKENPFVLSRHAIPTYKDFLEMVTYDREQIREQNLQGKVLLYSSYHGALTLSHLTAFALEKIVVIPMDYQRPRDPRILALVDQDLTLGVGKDISPQKDDGIEALRKAGRAGLILSSSGTTGDAKWVLHDFDALFGKYLKLQHPHTVPLVYQMDNISGIEVAISIASAGGTLIDPEERSPQQLSKKLQDLKVQPDLLSMTPSYLKLLLLNQISEVYNNVQHINLGGERLLQEDLRLFQEAFPKAQIHSFYGTTETSSIRTTTKEGTNWIKWGKEGVDFKVVEGELCLAASPYQMRKQLFQPTEESDWYATGDLVIPRDEGYYEVVGRKDAVFNVGGKKVDPAAVEQAIMRSTEVALCKVMAEPNALLGNMVVAKLVAAKGKSLEPSLRQLCREHLPEHAQPIKYYFVDSFELSSRLKAI